MEIIEKKVVIKLDKEERDTLISAIKLIERMNSKSSPICGERCPFKTACDERSNSTCYFEMVAQDLKYINNNCD